MSEFWDWWQHLPQNISPVLFEIGWFKVQYYGLSYIAAFAMTYFLVLYRIKHEERFAFNKDQINDITTYAILGLIIGARLGYVLFYNLAYYLQHPLEIFLPFSFSNGFRFTGISGMSYHGGLIGALLAVTWYIRKNKLEFWDAVDLYFTVVPLGYTFGRLGNFMNGELFGRVTTAPIGMVFPQAPDAALRHPSQLYEAFFEGIFLFFILWGIRNIKKPRGAMLAFYVIGYGTVRFFIEFFRQPDAHIGFVVLSFSMGQILCVLMIAGGIGLYLYLRQTQQRV
ncbi:MAG: prolipoprotein diacylglyceryl transferase [Deltaproteobacteria bacterium]|jgi:phosphatidylglycerol:prolipoprotein diacylglycerol transferase|nr:prolipoprotein diacylglyceryl transferase [Deltaproteobacteria bacterium]